MEYSYRKVIEKNKMIINKKYSGKVISNFARGMKNNLKSGIPIIEALELTKSYCSKSFKNTITLIQKYISEGFTISEAFEKLPSGFPELFKIMMGIGEESGSLEEVFSFLETYYMKEYKRRKKLINISIYPIFTLSISLILGMVIIAKILPKFISVIEGDKNSLPSITRFYMFFSDVFNDLGILAVPIIIILIAAVLTAVSKLVKTKGFLRLLYNNPLLKKFMRNKFESRFALAMWMMIKSGIDFKSCIQIIARGENEYLRSRLLVSIGEIEKGSMICDSMKSAGIFSKYFLANIYVGEINGSLEDVLKSAADVLEEETNLSIERIMNLMEPMLIIIVGLFTLSIILAIVLPMMSMYNITI